MKITYSELLCKVCQFANVLQEQGKMGAHKLFWLHERLNGPDGLLSSFQALRWGGKEIISDLLLCFKETQYGQYNACPPSRELVVGHGP